MPTRFYKKDGWTRALVLEYLKGINPNFDAGSLYFFSPHLDPYWQVIR